MPASQRPLKWSNRPFTLALCCGPRAHCGASAFRPGSFCFAFYRLPFDGRPRTKLVMLARTCGTSGACRAAVGAHTCTATAACAHTASGASVDSGTPPGFIVFPRIPVALFCKFFTPPACECCSGPPRIVCSPRISRSPRSGATSFPHKAGLHVAMAAPGTNTPAVRAPYVPAMPAHRPIPPDKSSNLVPPKHTLFFPPTGFARQWS
jgi:hypothetical protein